MRIQQIKRIVRIKQTGRRNQIPKKISAALFFLSLALLVVGIAISDSLPAVFSVAGGDILTIHQYMPLTVETDGTPDLVFRNSLPGQSESASIKLFGVVPIKDVSVSYVDPVYVVPGGQAFGIKIFTDGVMIVGITDVNADGGAASCPASAAGLQKGDVILAVNGATVSSNTELSDMIAQSGGQALTLSVIRKDASFEAELTPVKSTLDGSYKAGMWVRDSTAGIGTLTFYDPSDQIYGGLGHAVCDIDTGEQLPVLTGSIVNAGINGIEKGRKGVAGEVKGHFIEDDVLGNLLVNSECGVYGSYYSDRQDEQTVRVAQRQEITTGKACILSSVSGELAQYDCEIQKVNLKDSASLQNLVIRVTDQELIDLTGGIVQGMSGSPILQNGTLVGAVTHVFVDDPLSGYGIFAETMLSVSKQVSEISLQKAS